MMILSVAFKQSRLLPKANPPYEMEFNCTSDILHRVSALPNEADFEADELSDDDDCDSAHGDEFDIDDENEEDDDNDSEECKSSDIDSDNEEDLQDLTSVDDPSSKEERDAYLKFMQSMSTLDDDNDDEDEEEYRPDPGDGGLDDEDDDDNEEFAKVAKNELQELVNGCWQTIAGEDPLPPLTRVLETSKFVDLQPERVEDAVLISNSTNTEHRDSDNFEDSRSVGSEPSRTLSAPDNSRGLQLSPVDRTDHPCSQNDFDAIEAGNEAIEREWERGRGLHDCETEPSTFTLPGRVKGSSIISNLVSQIFSGETKPSEVCIEGMPLNAIRRIAARQMSMALQLLTQILVLVEDGSEAQELGYVCLMELNTQKNVSARKAALTQMNLHSVQTYQQSKHQSGHLSTDHDGSGGIVDFDQGATVPLTRGKVTRLSAGTYNSGAAGAYAASAAVGACDIPGLSDTARILDLVESARRRISFRQAQMQVSTGGGGGYACSGSSGDVDHPNHATQSANDVGIGSIGRMSAMEVAAVAAVGAVAGVGGPSPNGGTDMSMTRHSVSGSTALRSMTPYHDNSYSMSNMPSYVAAELPGVVTTGLTTSAPLAAVRPPPGTSSRPTYQDEFNRLQRHCAAMDAMAEQLQEWSSSRAEVYRRGRQWACLVPSRNYPLPESFLLDIVWTNSRPVGEGWAAPMVGSGDDVSQISYFNYSRNTHGRTAVLVEGGVDARQQQHQLLVSQLAGIGNNDSAESSEADFNADSVAAVAGPSSVPGGAAAAGGVATVASVEASLDIDCMRTFTPAEDDLLLRGLIHYSCEKNAASKQWRRIVSNYLPHTTAEQLHRRFEQLTTISAADSTKFKTYLKAEKGRVRKENWVHTEDLELLKGFQVFGNKWSLISLFFLAQYESKDLKQRWMLLQKMYHTMFESPIRPTQEDDRNASEGATSYTKVTVMSPAAQMFLHSLRGGSNQAYFDAAAVAASGANFPHSSAAVSNSSGGSGSGGGSLTLPPQNWISESLGEADQDQLEDSDEEDDGSAHANAAHRFAQLQHPRRRVMPATSSSSSTKRLSGGGGGGVDSRAPCGQERDGAVGSVGGACEGAAQSPYSSLMTSSSVTPLSNSQILAAQVLAGQKSSMGLGKNKRTRATAAAGVGAAGAAGVGLIGVDENVSKKSARKTGSGRVLATPFQPGPDYGMSTTNSSSPYAAVSLPPHPVHPYAYYPPPPTPFLMSHGYPLPPPVYPHMTPQPGPYIDPAAYPPYQYPYPPYGSYGPYNPYYPYGPYGPHPHTHPHPHSPYNSYPPAPFSGPVTGIAVPGVDPALYSTAQQSAVGGTGQFPVGYFPPPLMQHPLPQSTAGNTSFQHPVNFPPASDLAASDVGDGCGGNGRSGGADVITSNGNGSCSTSSSRRNADIYSSLVATEQTVDYGNDFCGQGEESTVGFADMSILRNFEDSMQASDDVRRQTSSRLPREISFPMSDNAIHYSIANVGSGVGVSTQTGGGATGAAAMARGVNSSSPVPHGLTSEDSLMSSDNMSFTNQMLGDLACMDYDLHSPKTDAKSSGSSGGRNDVPSVNNDFQGAVDIGDFTLPKQSQHAITSTGTARRIERQPSRGGGGGAGLAGRGSRGDCAEETLGPAAVGSGVLPASGLFAAVMRSANVS